MEEAQAALVVARLPGVTAALQRRILDTSGSFAAFLAQSASALPPDLIPLWRQWRADPTGHLEGVEALKHRAAALDCHLICATDPDYPPLLLQIHRPPPLLHVCGDPALLSLPQIAVVGSRNASRSGSSQAERFAAALVEAGFIVTSGLALGIDAAAHRGALNGGRTLAVLGCGVDVIYPRRNRALRQRILDGGGALVSELPPGSPPLRQHFPRRNRIISGLSAGVLVVEADLRSGSLITARLAMEQGREVFAMPGSVHNPCARGCHQLIREGAVLTETLDDMVAQIGGLLGFAATTGETVEGAASDFGAEVAHSAVLEALGFDPVDFDTLCRRLEIPVSELTAALVELELRGLVEQSGDRFQRCG